MSPPDCPYPGPAPFGRCAPHFVGREREAAELRRALVAQQVVLLHSPSGAGKTSLVEAGLAPLLQLDGYHVHPRILVSSAVPEEARAKNPKVNRYVLSMMAALDGARTPPGELAALTLGGYLERLHRDHAAAEPMEGVLFFDQFEDVVTLDPGDLDAKGEFFRELGKALRASEYLALFAVRDDFVAALDAYAARIPGQLTSRFPLRLLDTAAAVRAMTKPAEEVGVAVDEKAAGAVVEDLARVRVRGATGTQKGQYIEPVQLQVVCLQLWNGRDLKTNTIDGADVKRLKGVDDALARYYAASVEKVATASKVSERVIREWFGEKLISEGRVRDQVLKGEKTSGGLDNRAIEMLVDPYRLVQPESRSGADWYHLAHDRLVGPIHRNNLAWQRSNLRPIQRQAQAWNEAGRQENLLATGGLLREGLRWQKDSGDESNAIDREFLERSRQAHRLRWRIASGAAALVAAFGLVFGLYSRSAVERIRQSERRTHALVASQLAITPNHDVEALGEAILAEAMDGAAEADTRRGLTIATTSAVAQLIERAVPVAGVAISPDGEQVIAQVVTENDVIEDDYRWSGRLRAPAIHWRISVADAGTPAYAPPAAGALQYSSDLSRVLVQVGHDQVVLRDTINAGALGAPFAVPAPATPGECFLSPDGRVVGTYIDQLPVYFDALTGQPITGTRNQRALWQSMLPGTHGKIFVQSREGSPAAWDSLSEDVILAPNPSAPTPQGALVFAYAADRSRLAYSYLDRIEVARAPAANLAAPEVLAGSERAWSLDLSRDGNTLVSVEPDRAPRVWDLPTGRARRELLGHWAVTFSAAISPDGRRVVTGGLDGTVRVWRPDSGRSEWVLRCQSRAPGAEPNAARPCTDDPGEVETAALLDPGPNALLPYVATPFDDPPVDARMVGAGPTIVVAYSSGRSSVWEPSGRTSIVSPRSPTGAGPAPLITPDGARVFSPADGVLRTLASLTTPITLGNWPTTSSEQWVDQVALSRDGRFVAAALRGRARLWTTQLPGTPRELVTNQALISALAFTDDGTRLVAFSIDGDAWRWDTTTGVSEEIHLGTRDQDAGYKAPDRVAAAWLSPDGTRFATRDALGVMRAWEATAGDARALWDRSSSTPTEAPGLYAFAPSGAFVATTDRARRGMILGANDGGRAATLDAGGAQITTIEFSTDGRLLATAGTDGTASLWAVPDGRLLGSFMLPRRQVSFVHFSPDRRRLLVGGVAGVFSYPIEVGDLQRLACRLLQYRATTTGQMRTLCQPALNDRTR